MSDKISVVVPCYNAEEYLERCISSLLTQTHDNMEIILVDDGSKDNTLELCRKFEKEHNNVVVVAQENKGVSAARNAGIKAAKGEYIGFVDSDDWVAIDMYEKLYKKAIETESKFIICGYYEVTPDSIQAKTGIPKNARTKKTVLQNVVPAFSWNKLIHKSLMPYLKYPENVSMGEDMGAFTVLFSYADGFEYLDEPLYYYFQRESSMTHQLKNAKKMFSYVNGMKYALDNCNPEFLEYAAVSIANRIISNENWFLKYCLASVIEFVNQHLMKYFENNKIIKGSIVISKILNYPNIETIPHTVYIDAFGKKKISKDIINNLKKISFNPEIVILNEDNCDLKNAPNAVKKLYEEKQYEIVGHYFKMLNIFEKGGIGVDDKIEITAMFGNVRMNNSFFARKNETDFQLHVYGGRSKQKVFETLLSLFENDSIVNIFSMPFEEIVKEVLIEEYGLNKGGWTQTIRDKITVFKCDILSYEMNDNNISIIRLPNIAEVLKSGEYSIIEKKVIKYWDDDKNFFWKEKERLKRAGGATKVTNETGNNDLILEVCRNYENSTSWKITRPLRAIGKLFKRKNKKDKKKR